MPKSLNVGVFCSVDRSRVDAFAGLLGEIAPLVGPDALNSLESVMILDKDAMVPTVNALMRESGVTTPYEPNPSHPPEGLCVPIEVDGRLATFVLVSRSLVEPMTLEHNHQPDAVSTLLEELLHASVYEAAWKRRGYVHHPPKGILACEADLLVLVSRMCGEYVVIRRKVELMRTYGLVEFEPGGGLMAAEPSHPGSVVVTVAETSAKVGALVREAAIGLSSAPEAWSKLVSLLYRGILEPLARNAAYCDGASERATQELELWATGAAKWLVTFWAAVHSGLRRVHESELKDTEQVEQANLGGIKTLLSSIGVTYRPTESGDCWVEFRLA